MAKEPVSDEKVDLTELPEEEVLRTFPRKMDEALGAEVGRLLGRANMEMRSAEDAKKKAAKAFADQINKLDEECRGLEFASQAREGDEVFVPACCKARINIRTEKWDIYLVEHDKLLGEDVERLVKSEELPERLLRFLPKKQGDLFGDKGKKDGAGGGSATDADAVKDVEFPEEETEGDAEAPGDEDAAGDAPAESPPAAGRKRGSRKAA